MNASISEAAPRLDDADDGGAQGGGPGIRHSLISCAASIDKQKSTASPVS